MNGNTYGIVGGVFAIIILLIVLKVLGLTG